MTILETERLRIRYFQESDVPSAFEYSQEPCTREELPDEVFESLEETGERIRDLTQNYETLAYPLVYAVALKENDRPIGHASLSSIGEGKIEIGYAIATQYQGRGYASELIRPFAQWAKTALGANEIYGIARAGNAASWKCLEKAGFRLVQEEELDLFGGMNLVRTYTY